MTTIFDRLTALGHKPQTIRGKTFLDGMDVADIIDDVPVSYTRRRYSNATFCWVDAYFIGWFSLGDPWQAVTPSRKAIAAQLAARCPVVHGMGELACSSNP